MTNGQQIKKITGGKKPASMLSSIRIIKHVLSSVRCLAKMPAVFFFFCLWMNLIFICRLNPTKSNAIVVVNTWLNLLDRYLLRTIFTIANWLDQFVNIVRDVLYSKRIFSINFIIAGVCNAQNEFLYYFICMFDWTSMQRMNFTFRTGCTTKKTEGKCKKMSKRTECKCTSGDIRKLIELINQFKIL